MLGLLFILCVFSINDRVNPIQIVFQFQEKFIRLRRRPRALPVDECVKCARIIHELKYCCFGGFR
jgi:hypothetical protein